MRAPSVMVLLRCLLVPEGMLLNAAAAVDSQAARHVAAHASAW
jgi:hypothetical protein